MLSLSHTTTCTLRLGFLRLSLGLAGVRDNRCIVLTSMVLWCHRTLCFTEYAHWKVSLTLYVPRIVMRISKKQSCLHYPLHQSPSRSIQHFCTGGASGNHIFFSFYLWGWVLSLLCKITSILCILQCQLYNFFGGYLGCLPSLHSGFGLFWNTKKMKSCAYFCFILADKSSCALSTPVPSPPTLTLFGGHLGCVSSLNSGFGLVWNTKYEVFCLFLF